MWVEGTQMDRIHDDVAVHEPGVLSRTTLLLTARPLARVSSTGSER